MEFSLRGLRAGGGGGRAGSGGGGGGLQCLLFLQHCLNTELILKLRAMKRRGDAWVHSLLPGQLRGGE
jgi:hypothetical protein